MRRVERIERVMTALLARGLEGIPYQLDSYTLQNAHRCASQVVDYVERVDRDAYEARNRAEKLGLNEGRDDRCPPTVRPQ